jgi:DNA-binding transcriptional regulator YiaG
MTGPTLKKLRVQCRLTQPALAEQLGVHWNTVAKWEQEVRNIPAPIEKLLMLVLKPIKKGRR